jgi:sec-independent protein translocase protein TatA
VGPSLTDRRALRDEKSSAAAGFLEKTVLSKRTLRRANMFGLQPLHLIVIAAALLLLFGPSRLPEIGRAIGKSIAEFRDAASSIQGEVKKGLDEKPKSEDDSAKTDAQSKT